MRSREQRGRAWRGAVAVLWLFISASTVACAPWQVGAEKDVVKNGIEFETFKEGEGGSKLGILAKDTEIDGWPCAAGFVVLCPDWRPDELLLSREYQRNGISMPAGTWVFPNEQGNPGVCMFPRDVKIQGCLCRGSRLGKEGVMTSFHDNGKLKHFFVREDAVVNGVPCEASLFNGISLHENGRLKRCKLAEQTVIGGVKYPKGTVLRFAENGMVVEDK